MREKITQQQPLMPAPINHKHAKELIQISLVLDQLSDVTELVHRDLVRPGTRPHQGRRGMSAEQVLRALIIKLMNGWAERSPHLSNEVRRVSDRSAKVYAGWARQG